MNEQEEGTLICWGRTTDELAGVVDGEINTKTFFSLPLAFSTSWQVQRERKGTHPTVGARAKEGAAVAGAKVVEEEDRQ
jgi:hypothetical protein